MEKAIRDMADKLHPEREFTVRVDRLEWITNELLQIYRDRDRCMQIARRSGLEEDRVFARAYRNFANSSTRKAKGTYIKAQLAKYKNDPKKFWETISQVLPKRTKKKWVKLIDSDGNMTPDERVSAIINKFFSEIGGTTLYYDCICICYMCLCDDVKGSGLGY